jgi:signal peptidase
MNVITDSLNEIRKMRFRKLILQGLNFGMIVCSALMIWKTLMVVTMTESPVVVVLSGSMEPSYYRGDILFLLKKETVVPGDIIVYQLKGEAIPIVHRVITVQ